jgi:single-stranded-DNA-specific exonuclease
VCRAAQALVDILDKHVASPKPEYDKAQYAGAMAACEQAMGRKELKSAISRHRLKRICALHWAHEQALLDVRQSVCGRAWRDRLDERGAARALAITQRNGMSELLARVLAGRGVEADGVAEFLDPTVRRLMPDPDVLTDMAKAAARIADAVRRRETIAVFGDYDVDGATSAAVLATFLRHGGIEPLIHIPDRLFEGYGPNTEAVRALAGKGARLLVTVDCGTTSIAPLAEAKKLGLDVVTIDHHQTDEALPPVDALVNPNRQDDLSGLSHLAAVGSCS